jgi:hypothetical protein
MTDRKVRILAVALVIHAIMLKLTWLDLRKRPDTAVRGTKRFWRLASSVNTTGSVAYWLFGRRHAPAAAPAVVSG